ncbi:hypothetical protein BGZ83_002114 [Gryganskiella cystojenkinii]|nr:hypothetical protein BGZ83_002114 [Gryganskiella cystojenkinii]
MSLCPLPLECLQLIFQVLYERGEIHALQRLLQVNSFFLTAALPFLYRDPTYRPDFDPTKSLYHPSLYKSVQNILRQRPPNEISNLLNAAFDVFPEHVNDKRSDDTNKDDKNTGQKDNLKEPTDLQEQNQDKDQLQDQDSIKKRGVDYLSFVRIFDFENVVFKDFGRRARLDHPVRLLDYALRSSVTGEMATEYGQGYHDQDLLFPPLKIMSAVLFSRSNLTLHFPVNMRQFRQAALATSIRRDLTWVFCSPVMENVEVLTIPLSDIDRYLACVSKFKSLINISFLMDEFFDSVIVGDQSADTFNSNNGAGIIGQEAMDGPPVDQDLEETKQAMRAKRNQQFKTMFEFVKQHLVHFPKQLQQAECPPDWNWEIGDVGRAHCSQEFLDELKRLLPPAHQVSMINDANVIQVVNHIQSTNLDSVEQIELLRFESSNSVVKSMMANLKRCRGLKRFSMRFPGPEAFKWAVEERLAWDRYHAAVAARAAAIRTGSKTNSVLFSVTPVPPPLPLVPLEAICVHTPTKRELDDIVFAFGASLKILSAAVGPPGFEAEAEAAERAYVAAGQPFMPVFLDFRIGAEPCWSQLPTLTKILLSASRRVRFVIKHDFFTSLGSCHTKCSAGRGFHTNIKDENDPNRDNEDERGNGNHKLESLTVKDGFDGPYRCLDLYNCEPFLELRPKITYIQLSGSPALVFHPYSLHQTPNLQELRLEYSRDQGWSFIPPAEELKASFRDVSSEALQGSNKSLSPSSTDPPALGHRAAWTWDWQLPHLTLLQLSGEFAFLFKFQMLVGCPSLESLQIDITTREGLHQRVLSVHDFMADSSVSSGDSESDQQLQVITASSLKELTLKGPWFLDDETIQVMYGSAMNRPAVFSKLALLAEFGILAGYSLKVWLALMQGLPDLKRTYCGLYEESEVGAEILKNNYGLVQYARSQTVRPNDTTYYIYGQHWYFPDDSLDKNFEVEE